MALADLTWMPVEVAPIAHYHMGGVKTDARMQTEVPGLLVAGEAVGGANGANRLSGNAITEALVFGRRALQHWARQMEFFRSSHPQSRGGSDRKYTLPAIVLQSRTEPACQMISIVSVLRLTRSLNKPTCARLLRCRR